MRRYVWALCVSTILGGCRAQLPAHWVQGGSPLELPRARWTRGEVIVDVMPDGKVLANGDHLFTLDRAGRVFDRDNDAIALIEPNGQIIGKNEQPLGNVGLRNAAPPGVEVAWLAIEPSGEVTRFDPDGRPFPGGAWSGCSGAALRTCTLTTHVITLAESTMRRRGSAVRVGIGMGVGTGMGAGYGAFVMP